MSPSNASETMASKKTPAKKKAAKKAAAKKPAAKKAAAKKATAKKPARAVKKKPARSKTTVTREQLPEGVERVMVSVLQIFNVVPVNLGINDVSGTPQVFYGTTQIDSEIDDVFDYATTVASVDWIVKNNATYPVDVTFGSGAPVTLNHGDATKTNLTMPAPYGCNGTNLFVQRDGQIKHDPVIKLKRKDASGGTPNC